MDVSLSAPRTPDSRIHLAVRPHSGSDPATYLATEIGKSLVSEEFLDFPGLGAMLRRSAIAIPQEDTPS